jgi:hypothetical protein
VDQREDIDQVVPENGSLKDDRDLENVVDVICLKLTLGTAKKVVLVLSNVEVFLDPRPDIVEKAA